jgi:hypothetical protein
MPAFRLLLFACVCLSGEAASGGETRRLSESDLRDKIHGWWIGQIAGNYLGFPFENLYTDEPIPILIDRYHDFRDAAPSGLRMNLDDRRAYIRIMADAMGGAWSDDDTDVELVTLHAVETHGLGLTYPQITAEWRAHINRFIWSASRVARDLMEQGHLPPATGSRTLNPHWFSLSSQLKTEIWGVFYAGMPAAAATRAEWDARIMTDAWATHPDIVYASMISEAFFETDPRRLVESALSRLPAASPFARGIRDVLRWRDAHPDWRDTRRLLHESYYREVDGFVIPVPVLGSVINGLCGIMALLYGEGDFTRTVAIATSAGYDCDNQAATLGGLLGVMHGASSIPEHFTHDLPSRGRWKAPFNDTYINYSRDGLPNHTTITALVDRLLAVTKTAIVAQGGRRLQEEDVTVYEIRSVATLALSVSLPPDISPEPGTNPRSTPLIDR